MKNTTVPSYCFVYKHQKKIALASASLVIFFTSNPALALIVFAFLFIGLKTDRTSHFRNTAIVPIQRDVTNQMSEDFSVMLLACSIIHLPAAYAFWYFAVPVNIIKFMFITSTALYLSFVALFYRLEHRWIMFISKLPFVYGINGRFFNIKTHSYYHARFIAFTSLYLIYIIFYILQNKLSINTATSVLICANWTIIPFVVRLKMLKNIVSDYNA